MGVNYPKYYITNPSLDISKQGRPTKSMHGILSKTPYEESLFIKWRKFSVSVEIVHDGNTGEPIVRMRFPADTQEKIDKGELAIDYDSLQIFGDKLIAKYLARRSQVKTLVYRKTN
jgi:hypothetical protein